MKKLLMLLIICSCFLFSKIGLANSILITEGFEGPGYENSEWVEYLDDANCYINSERLCEVCPPMTGNYCLEAYSSGLNKRARAIYILDSPNYSNEVSVNVKLTKHNLTESKVVEMIVLATKNGSKCVIVEYYRIQYDIYLVAKYLSNQQWVYGPTYIIPINHWEWNLIYFKYDLDNLKWKFKLNNRTLDIADISPNSIPNVQRLDIGICKNNGNGPAEVLISSIEWTN